MELGFVSEAPGELTVSQVVVGAGIGSVQSLAEADVAAVASLPGVSTRMASAFIRDALRLVRDRGTRVLFDEGVTSRLGNGPQ